MSLYRKFTCALLAAPMLAAAGAAHGQVVAGPIANAANGHNYYVIRIANFDDYRIAAQNLGGYPIVINNAAENDWVLANLMPEVPAVFTFAYIGLSDRGFEGEWLWEAGTQDRFTNWNTGEPNNQNNEDYASMIRTGRWNDTILVPAHPNNGLPYAFVEVGGGPVGEPAGVYAGPICDPATGSEYYLLTSSLVGPARQFAQTTLGGDLVTIETADENKFVAIHLAALSNIGPYVYIGLSDAAVENSFAWLSGSTSTFRRWLPGEPNNFNNEDYVVMGTTSSTSGQFSFWIDTINAPRLSVVEVQRCPGDFNKSGQVSVQDIFDYLAAYFAGCP